MTFVKVAFYISPPFSPIGVDSTRGIICRVFFLPRCFLPRSWKRCYICPISAAIWRKQIFHGISGKRFALWQNATSRFPFFCPRTGATSIVIICRGVSLAPRSSLASLPSERTSHTFVVRAGPSFAQTNFARGVSGREAFGLRAVWNVE